MGNCGRFIQPVTPHISLMMCWLVTKIECIHIALVNKLQCPSGIVSIATRCLIS